MRHLSDLNFIVVDAISKTVFNNDTAEVKGVGEAPEKAFIRGIRKIKGKKKKGREGGGKEEGEEKERWTDCIEP